MPYADPERARAHARDYRAAHLESVTAYFTTHREEKKAYDVAHREERTAADRKRKHGITQDEWNGLLAYYDGLCAAGCGRPATCLDHDHDTGDIRGPLCHSCNQRDALAIFLPYAVPGVGAW